jgi:hypothetical protein
LWCHSLRKLDSFIIRHKKNNNSSPVKKDGRPWCCACRRS